jgi:hypothetical protein
VLKTVRSATIPSPDAVVCASGHAYYDLRALYRFIRHLGIAGELAPAYVPPEQEPKGPVIAFPAPQK